MNDEAQLLKRYAETHAEAAFAEIVRRHVALVYSAARRQVGVDEKHLGVVRHEIEKAELPSVPKK